MGIFFQMNTRSRMPRIFAAMLALLLLLQTLPFFVMADGTDDTEQVTEEATGITEEPAEEAAETETTDIPETAEIQRFFPDYTLDDYADVMYGTGTIKNNGCSVCCMAVVATYLTGHQYYPDELAKWFGGKAENNTDRIRYMAQALQLREKSSSS